MSEIAAVSSSGSTSASSVTSGQQDVSRDQFMQLLVTQLQNQDPLDPVKNEDFIAQLAQLESLEQSTQLNENISAMTLQQGLLSGSALIGLQVTGKMEDGSSVLGMAQSVTMKNGVAHVTVNGTSLPLGDITEVEYGQ